MYIVVISFESQDFLQLDQGFAHLRRNSHKMHYFDEKIKHLNTHFRGQIQTVLIVQTVLR